MNGLMLHCGANYIEREALRALPDPEPMGPRHSPIRFDAFLDALHNSFAAYGMKVKEEAYGLTEDHKRFFGLASVTIQNEHADYDYVTGMRCSTDQSFSNAISSGARVFVCDNLAFNGEFVLRRKSTTNVMEDLPFLLFKATANIRIEAALVEQKYERYKHTYLGEKDADSAILEMFRHKVISPREFPKVLEEWDNPSHEEFSDRNVWRLFNAATEAMKIEEGANSRIPTLAGKTMKLHNLCDKIAA